MGKKKKKAKRVSIEQSEQWKSHRRQRIILLPGFGEDERIFSLLLPYLKGFDVICVDYRNALSKFSLRQLSIKSYIVELVKEYQITADDLLVGHSMGGYYSHHIRQITDAPNCMIASFTDPRKVNGLFNNARISSWATKNGILTSQITRTFFWLKYRKRKSMEPLTITQEVFEQYTTEELCKQIKLILERPGGILNWLRSKPRYRLAPSLMLHPIGDWVVNIPEEEHVLVEGDHFDLITHPDIVGTILREWLEKESKHYREEYEDFLTPALWEKSAS